MPFALGYGLGLQYGGSVKPIPEVDSSNVDTTGLILTINWSVPVTLNTGNMVPDSYSIDTTGLFLTVNFPSATYLNLPVVTADGDEITVAYTGGSGTAAWTYAITNGNPSGNPVLAGAVCLMDIPQGMAVSANGVPNAAVSGASVTNNSTVTYSAWWDAANSFSDAGTTPCANNEPVYQITRSYQSGTNAVQTTLAARPLFKTNIQNGLPCVLSDGTDDLMTFTAVNFGTGDYTLQFVAARVDVGADMAAVVGDNNNGYFAFRKATMSLYTPAGNSVLSFSFLTFNTWTVVRSSGTVTVYKDGTANTPAAAASACSFNKMFAYTPAGTVYGATYFGELIAKAFAVGTTERQRGESYLRTKWGTP